MCNAADVTELPFVLEGELIGTAIAVLGAAYLAFGGKNDGGATVYGDFLSVIAVLAYVMYFVLGRRVRGFVPIFTYMLLVTGGEHMRQSRAKMPSISCLPLYT